MWGLWAHEIMSPVGGQPALHLLSSVLKVQVNVLRNGCAQMHMEGMRLCSLAV